MKEVHLTRMAFTFRAEEGLSQRLQVCGCYLETTVCLTGWAVIDHHVTLAEQSIPMD